MSNILRALKGLGANVDKLPIVIIDKHGKLTDEVVTEGQFHAIENDGNAGRYKPTKPYSKKLPKLR